MINYSAVGVVTLASIFYGLPYLADKVTEKFSQINLTELSGSLAQKITNISSAFLAKLGTEGLSGEAAEKIHGTVETFTEKINADDIGEMLGTMFGDGMKSFSKVFGKGLNVSFDNTFGSLLRQFSFQYFPYILAMIASYYGVPLVVKYLYHRLIHNIGRPKLATEIHQRTIFTPLLEKVRSIFSRSQAQSQPIYNAEITGRITNLTQAVTNIRKNGGYFPNVLFYGPGGTGKTMISEFIAKNSGMSYIKMSGGDLAQYIKRGEHVSEFNKIMDKMNVSWRPWSTQPWLFFIDESESLCRDRGKLPSQELLELQNAFLNRTGTQSNRFMLVLATNRMEDLDEAVLSRMDHKIHIGPPAEAERAQILQSYVGQFFSKAEQQAFFSPAQIGAIAKKTEGLTGRALFKMLNAIASKKSASKDNKLTQVMIDKSVTEFVEQEREVEQRRALKAGEAQQASLPSKAIPEMARPTPPMPRAAPAA